MFIKFMLLDSILLEFNDIFSETLGNFKRSPISIMTDENCAPKYLKACNVSFTLTNKIIHEIQNMVNKGILEPISYSDWATPVVQLSKKL